MFPVAVQLKYFYDVWGSDVFAAYVAYTDHEIGRVIQAVEDLGKWVAPGT